jgi:hypothetical protein
MTTRLKIATGRDPTQRTRIVSGSRALFLGGFTNLPNDPARKLKGGSLESNNTEFIQAKLMTIGRG